MNLTLFVWRQKSAEDRGRMERYEAVDINSHMSFLEMLDVVNEGLIAKGEEPIAFDSDCREGICGMCGFMINGIAHGPERGTTVESVEARGKHLLVHLGDGSVLHTHMHMDGSWHVYRVGERWRAPGREARVVLETDDGTQAVCFSAPLVELRGATDRRPTRATRTLAELGPNLCDPEPDFDEVLRRLAKAAQSAPDAPEMPTTSRRGAMVRLARTSLRRARCRPGAPNGPASALPPEDRTGSS